MWFQPWNIYYAPGVSSLTDMSAIQEPIIIIIIIIIMHTIPASIFSAILYLQAKPKCNMGSILLAK